MAIRVVILGAGGRDFHNFNVYFRDRPEYEVAAFTATQIPDIEGRTYPPALAGPRYPRGIPIVAEEELPRLLAGRRIDQVVFAYSDVSHEQVMHLASQSLAAGAGFRLLGPDETMLPSAVPVVAVGAVRTGSGKSQTTRRLAAILRGMGRRVVVIRHPMAYRDLAAQAVQRFATLEDLDRAGVTIEEREEFEPHLAAGTVVYAGVDYAPILRQAEEEAEVILWDGGNNDFPFIRPDLFIVIADPHRPGHELRYHPGETNLRMADVVVINKVDSAAPEQVQAVRRNIAAVNPRAAIVEAASPISVDQPDLLAGRRAVVVEDGPTVTHGEMPHGAGYLAAQRGGAQVVDPRPYAVGSLRDLYRRYPHLGPVLPAMGYGAAQVKELEETLARTEADVVVIGTPVDLRRVLRLGRPAVRVTYELAERATPTLADLLSDWWVRNGGRSRTGQTEGRSRSG
ncbi:MAG TPA: cyclic 2,3-diphosphoglycerate synthase [bacterium]|nr:cyclic 2,3-diphosphoglycerate synthase [bacterium]